MSIIPPIQFKDDELILLDQRKLPNEEVLVKCKTLQEGYTAIKDMVVRGAPCIGFTGIFTLALWIKNNNEFNFTEFSIPSLEIEHDYLNRFYHR